MKQMGEYNICVIVELSFILFQVQTPGDLMCLGISRHVSLAFRYSSGVGVCGLHK